MITAEEQRGVPRILLGQLLHALPKAIMNEADLLQPDDGQCAAKLLKTAALKLLIVVTLDQIDAEVPELFKTILQETETVRIVVVSSTEESIDSSEFKFMLQGLKPIDRARMFFDIAKSAFDGQLNNLLLTVLRSNQRRLAH